MTDDDQDPFLDCNCPRWCVGGFKDRFEKASTAPDAPQRFAAALDESDGSLTSFVSALLGATEDEDKANIDRYVATQLSLGSTTTTTDQIMKYIQLVADGTLPGLRIAVPKPVDLLWSPEDHFPTLIIVPVPPA